MGRVNRLGNLVSLPALVATLACVLWLARLETGGPSHSSLQLAGDIPATLYLPDPEDVPESAPPEPSPASLSEVAAPESEDPRSPLSAPRRFG